MTRRNVLNEIQKSNTTHAGLWLDKFLKDNEAGSKQSLIEEACSIPVPDGYKKAFERRQSAHPNALKAPATVDMGCRMVIGLGQKGVVEAGITLDHTWGVPYIPGSALKGIAAWAARNCSDARWHENGDCYLALFGGPDSDGKNDEKGCVIFHDAWLMPDSQWPAMHLDVMTVHHQQYYQATDNTPPSDMDSPVPVAFASIRGKFEIMLEGPEEWCDAAMSLLKTGLKEHGIGAKTAGGYGRMVVAKTQEELQGEKAQKEQAEAARIEQERPSTADALFEKYGCSELKSNNLDILEKLWEKELGTNRKLNDAEVAKFKEKIRKLDALKTYVKNARKHPDSNWPEWKRWLLSDE